MCFLKGLVMRRWREAINQWRRERQQQQQHDETAAVNAAAASAAAAAQINARVALEQRAANAEARARRWEERFSECETERELLRQQLRQLRLTVHQQGAQQQRQGQQEQPPPQQALMLMGEDDRATKRAHESPTKGAVVPAATESPTATGRAQDAAASTPPLAPKKPRALEGCFEASSSGVGGRGGLGRGGHSGGRGRGRGPVVTMRPEALTFTTAMLTALPQAAFTRLSPCRCLILASGRASQWSTSLHHHSRRI